MPTGSGKSIVISAIVDCLDGRQILIITPRKRLLLQTCTRLRHHGVLSAGLGNDLGHGHRVVAGTYQTMVRRSEMAAPDVIIIDECHLVPPDGSYAELLRRFPRAAVVGLTATPFRAQRHIRYCGIDWQQGFEVPMVDLIDQGVLVRPISMSTGKGFSMPEDETASLEEVTTRIAPGLRASVASERRSRCVVFCADIAHAVFTAGQLRAQGEASVHVVHSKQRGDVQEAEIQAFQSAAGRSWLINVNLISVGVDIPCIDAVAILRNVSSLALLIQMIGRGLRIFDGKADCLVWDYGNGTRRFGFIDDPRLDANEAGTAPPSQKTCPTCSALLLALARSCPRCGHEFSRSVSLNDAASGSPLLSADYRVATYGGARVTRDARGIWIVQHELIDDGVRLVSTTSARSEADARMAVRPAGTSVLVRRLAGRQVKICCTHRHPPS